MKKPAKPWSRRKPPKIKSHPEDQMGQRRSKRSTRRASHGDRSSWWQDDRVPGPNSDTEESGEWGEWPA